MIADKVSSGVAGLDEVLGGGFPAYRLHLIEGGPGVGKYGSERRRMRVMKLRGAQYRGGYHDMVIETGGIHVFPRLVAAEHHTAFRNERRSSTSTAAKCSSAPTGPIITC